SKVIVPPVTPSAAITYGRMMSWRKPVTPIDPASIPGSTTATACPRRRVFRFVCNLMVCWKYRLLPLSYGAAVSLVAVAVFSEHIRTCYRGRLSGASIIVTGGRHYFISIHGKSIPSSPGYHASMWKRVFLTIRILIAWRHGYDPF